LDREQFHVFIKSSFVMQFPPGGHPADCAKMAMMAITTSNSVRVKAAVLGHRGKGNHNG
jgi:hypothetical protein